MKESELRKLIKEEIKKVINEEYIELMDIGFKEFAPVIVRYYNWEKASVRNYRSSENSKVGDGWNTRDAKIEILKSLLDQLNKGSKNKDNIKIA